MMVLPLPSFLLDYCIILNLACGVVLLIGVVYLREPESFTSLPSLLLLATLFRLSLNVSTTRQILSAGVAPDMVKAFGEFMVRGNFVVGLTIFLIITLIQFVVIAKGSERVAEVAARFTLDALPGKQMSIDADLRSGVISIEQARGRRALLQREARLYAALDGAMKFVKGDAIAGIVISAVNIAAGLIVGTLQLGLSFSEAAESFTIYAVGDGLSSQIPALLVSVAAGIAVTRVADKDSDLLSRDIFGQLTQEPKALLATAAVMGVFSVFPGMPILPFLSAAVFFILLAKAVNSANRSESQVQVTSTFNAKPTSDISVRLSLEALHEIQNCKSFVSDIQKLREDIFSETGVLVVEPDFDVVSLKEVGTFFEVWIRGSRTFASRDITSVDSILAALKQAMAFRLSEFVDDTQSRMLLEFHSPACEDIVNFLIPEKYPVTSLTQILRQLVIEQVSIKNLKVILQALSEFVEAGSSDVFSRAVVSTGDSPRHALMVVRRALGKQIVQGLLSDSEQLKSIVIQPQLDAQISDLEENRVPLAPCLQKHIVSQIVASGELDAVVCSSAARLAIWRVLEQAKINLPVVAIEEVPLDVKVQQIGEVASVEALSIA